MENMKLVEVYRAANMLQAHLFGGVLEESGIPVHLGGDALQMGLGEFPIGWETAPRIMVAENDAAAAREILMRIEKGEFECGMEGGTDPPDDSAS